MALFKSLHNVFRRPDENASHTNTTHLPPQSFNQPPPSTLLPLNLPSKLLGSPHIPEETPDLYYEDRALGHSISNLEQVRIALSQLTASTNEHKDMLIAVANSERTLGDTMTDVMEPRHYDRDDDYDDLNVGDNDDNADDGHFSGHLPIDAREMQRALGRGLASHAEATVKLGSAMSGPINELTGSFEERYARKIVPLKRRYGDQKGQYLKYMRNADLAESDDKRSYYEALAEAAKPVWVATSTELRTESDVMCELTAKNMAKWSRNLAMQHERALAIAAANFKDAFNKAKSMTSLSRAK